MKLSKDIPFDSDMFMDLVVMFQDNDHIRDLHCFTDDEALQTLDKDELVKRITKSFNIDLEKVQKITKKSLDTNDLVKLAHCAIDIANKSDSSMDQIPVPKRKSVDKGTSSAEGKKTKLHEPSVSLI